MAEDRALSQWDVDVLLDQAVGASDALDAGRVGGPPPERAIARAIKSYDFRRPDKFSKEQWASLQSMHDHFARLISATFSSRLRTLVSVRLSSIDQGLYEEWQAQVPEQTVCYVISLRPLSGNVVVEFDMDIASEVIDRLLGGNGVLIDRARDLSEVELGLLRSFSRLVGKCLEETWAHVQPVNPRLHDLGLDAALIQVAAPTDVVINAFFEVNIGNHLGSMSVCLPYTVLEPVAGSLSTQLWVAGGQRGEVTDAQREQMQSLLGRSSLELSVRLGGVAVPARTIVEMQEGDTFVLETLVGRPLDVVIGERPRFRGLPGTVRNHLALQIAEVVEEPSFGFEGRSFVPSAVDEPDEPPQPSTAEAFGLPPVPAGSIDVEA
jgi:flagellar motor switch protein FliM